MIIDECSSVNVTFLCYDTADCVLTNAGRLHARRHQVDPSGLSKERFTLHDRLFAHERATVRTVGRREYSAAIIFCLNTITVGLM